MLLRKERPGNILDKLEQEAKKKLPHEIYDYVAGGAGDESTVERNRSAYLDFALVPRVLNNSNVHIDTGIEILGLRCSSPIIIDPTPFHGLFNSDKELATAKAAEETGSIMSVSMMSNMTLEEISHSVHSPLWFQLHIHRDHKITEQLVKRAERANFKAIIVTVDVPQIGIRCRDITNNFKIPNDCVPMNFVSTSSSGEKQNDQTVDTAYVEFNPLTSWDDIKWIRSITSLPIILKGIMHHMDALEALNCGVNAIIISNHGGRQLDGVAATIEVLPNIKSIIKDKIPLLIDGGIRSGTDVLKALALGANAILLGRPILFGLAARGKEGVLQTINSLQDELTLTMRLVGCASIDDIRNNGSSLFLSTEKLSYDHSDFKSISTEISHIKKEIQNIAAKQAEELSNMSACLFENHKKKNPMSDSDQNDG